MQQKKHFILVDDDADDRELFEEAVAQACPGTTLTMFKDAESAWEYFLSGEAVLPSVLFLDINLPRMSGWELLRLLREDPALDKILITMYSTSSHDRDKDIADNLGADGFVTKPSDFQQLVDILAKIAAHKLGKKFVLQ